MLARGRSALVILLLTPLVLSSLSCRPAERAAAAEGTAAPLSAADMAAIRSVDSSFATAAEAGSAEAVAALYAPDAKVLPPNAPIVAGRDAIQRFWGGFLAAYQLKFTIVADEVDGRGDLAYARGHYTMRGTPRGAGAKPFEETGKYLEVLRRGADGSWRYALDMYSSDSPLP